MSDTKVTPAPSAKDPYLVMLDQWVEAAEKLSVMKDKEMNLRQMLFAGAFPNPKEGTNKHLLPDGRTVKGAYRINRKIDEAALPASLAALRANGVANVDAIVRMKPELAKREWDSLSDENKLVFSAAIIATPGSPTLEIVPAKVDV